MGTPALLAVIGVLMAGVMGAGWAWERARRDATIVDVLWAAGMGLAALVFAAGGSGAALPRVLLALLAGGWALRLAVHLALRARGRPEDGRYRHLRRHQRHQRRLRRCLRHGKGRRAVLHRSLHLCRQGRQGG